MTWTAPQIRTVTPWEAEVGDIVTIEGANFTTNATVRFDAVVGDTTFIADTILQAEVPAVGSGWVEVVVDVPGGQASNPGSLKVVPSMVAISPFPAAVGTKVTITGAGFVPGCHVLFRGLELDPSAVALNGTTVEVTLPAPQGPFDDFGGIEPVSVRNPDGVASASFDLLLRRVLSTGFDVTRNGYAFLNAPLAGLADLGTFKETYGLAEVASSFLLEPVLTGAWYAYYRSFFNKTQPGYSSGFSKTAADEYWSGNPDLFTDHAALPEVERLLTVAQGHILSREMLTKLAGQALAGIGRAETSLAEVEVAFLNQLSMTAEERRRTAPIMQLIPAGTITTPGFITKLGDSHGLLPIRMEYPAGDTWERRLVVYDNVGEVRKESQLVFTRTSVGLEFVLSGDTSNRNTANGWTLSQATLQDNWLDDVSMPLEYMYLLAAAVGAPQPAILLVEDDQGRRFGVSSNRKLWNDLPDVIPAIGAENLYLLPLDRNLRFFVTGMGDGTYTLAIVAGSLGRSITLVDVPVRPGTRDVVKIADGLREVTLSSGDAEKELTLHYGVGGVRQARALTVTGVRVGQRGGLTLRSSDNLSSFELEGDAPRHLVTFGLSAADHEDVHQQRFDQVPLGDRQVRTFQVADWGTLGPDSLHSDEQ